MISFSPLRSLRARFAVVVATVVLVLSCVFGAVIGESSISRLKEQTGQQLREAAFSMVDRLDRDMSARSKMLTVLSDLQALRHPDKIGEAHKLLNHLGHDFPSYSWIGLTNSNGKVVASTGNILKDADISRRPVFMNGLEAIFIGDVHDAVLLAKLLPNPSGEAMKFVDISMPVRDELGQLVGVLAAHLSWEWAEEVGELLLEPLQKRLPELEFLVVNKDRTVLLGPKAMIGKPVSVALGDSGEKDWSVVRWPDGSRYLTAYAESVGFEDYPGLGWTVIARQPAAIAFAEASDIRNEIFLWGALLSFVFASIGWVVAGMVTKPLKQIVTAAAQISQGADVRIPLLTSTREVEALSVAINHLVNSLTKKRTQLAIVEGIAYRDSVTGLPNRAALNKYVEAVRYSGEQRPSYGVLCLDLDGFKPVNDIFGHGAGDSLLQEVGLRLSASIRDGDIAVRHGGDEFVLLLSLRPGESMENVQRAAERIIARLAEPVALQNKSIHIGCSVGGALWSKGRFSEALLAADEALYRAKAAGKGRASFNICGTDAVQVNKICVV